MRRLATRVAAALFVLAGVAPGAAQTAAPDASGPLGARRVDLVLRGVPAGEALAAFADAAGVDVAYSTALVGTRPVWCGRPGGTADALLRCITDAVGLDYVRRSSGTVVVTERVVAPVRPGAVAGLVVDGETGEPLPFATVRVAGAAAVTDAAGRFDVGPLAPGPYVLASSYVGYVAAETRVAVAPGAVATATIGLRPAAVAVGTVVVDGFERRAASERLGAEADVEAPGERRLAGRPAAPGAEVGVPSLVGGPPAVTSSVDGAGLRLLLGVSERTFRDGLSLQGGEPGEHVLQIDGATVYEPVALGPVLGAMSPLAVGRVTVRKAGFGARHGSFLAGVLQADHAMAGPPGQTVLAEVDAFAANVRVQHARRVGRWGGAPAEAAGFVAVRRSLWDVAPPAAFERALREWNDVDPVLAAALDGTAVRPRYDLHRHGSDVAFSDLHAAARVQAGPLRSARASLYRGTARVGTDLLAVGAPLTEAPLADTSDTGALLLARDATRWTNTAATLRADAVVSARWRVGAGARLSHHTLRQRYDAATGPLSDAGSAAALDADGARLAAALDARAAPDNGNDVLDLRLDADAALALAPGHEVVAGVEAAAVRGRFHLLAGDAGAGAFGDLDARQTQVRVAVFAEGTHRLGPRLTLEPGLRLTAVAATGDVLAEPRVALRMDARDGDRLAGIALRGVSLRLAAGVYRQFATRVELATVGPSALVPSVALWLPADGSVAPPSALHLAVEVLWEPSPAWSVRAEGYAKAMPHVYALDYRALLADAAPGAAPLARQADFLLHETGRALGTGLRVERLAPRWAATAGVAVARTERRSDARFGGRWVPAAWAEPVRATLGLDVLAWGRRDGTGLLVRARGLGVWGRAWAYRRAYYDVLPAAGSAPVAARPEDDRLPPRLALDVGLAYTRRLGGARRVEVAADVANVLDRRDVLDWSLRPGPDGALAPVTRRLPGAQPSLRVRVSL